MDNPSLVSAIDKLAIAGERVGLTVEQLIRLVNAGLTVDALLEIVGTRLIAAEQLSCAGAKRFAPVPAAPCTRPRIPLIP
jgi:hypothetical protein